jgi:hypothetical protein
LIDGSLHARCGHERMSREESLNVVSDACNPPGYRESRFIVVGYGALRLTHPTCSNDELVNLWEHVVLVHELVGRFLLTAIGYSGQYGCYIGGFHIAPFPPPSRNLN